MSIQTILRTLVASGFVVGAVAALSPAAFAATDNDTQSGSITAIETVDYVAGPSLAIAPNTLQTDEDFGSVNVQSNANAGWTLAVASTNGSVLKHTTIVTSPPTIAYSLKVAGNAITGLTTPAASVQAKDVSVLTASATGGADYPVLGTIAAAASEGKPAGIYSDTLTFTLTNK